MPVATKDLTALDAAKAAKRREAQEFIAGIEGEPNAEQRTQLRDFAKSIDDIDKEIEDAGKDNDALSTISGPDKNDEARTAAGRQSLYPANDEGLRGPGALSEEQQTVLRDLYDTPGGVFTRSEGYQDWIKRFPDGGPSMPMTFNGDPVMVPNIRQLLDLKTPAERMTGIPDKLRALVTSGDPSAGTLVRPDFRGLLEPGLVRPLSVRQLVTVIPVSTDSIEYVREASRVSAAAPVAEATSITGTSGTKPEGALAFAVVTDVVRTIAEWIGATRRILQDAPALRAYIDQFLTDDLALELEDQIITGSGSGENFTGILNTAGIQTAGPPSGTGNTVLDVIRTAKRQIRTVARTDATAVLINPSDAEIIDRLKDTTGRFLGPGPFAGEGIVPRVWGVPIVESEAVPAGTALMGDFRRAVLFDREATTLQVGTVNDDFIRNIVRVLAELRAGFGVLRPTAFVAIDVA